MFLVRKRKLARLEKRLAFSDHHFSIVGSTSDEGFARLESSLSIGKLCFSEAASYYNNFNMRKHKMTLFENTINDNAELIYRFLGWAHLLSIVRGFYC